MLRFKVFDDDGPARDWPLVGAHLLGPDDAPVSGRVGFKDGCVVARASGTHARALALQHDAGRSGRLMLQTCLLPRRDEPYHLTVELARHRIKAFIAKSEEWQLFDLNPDHPAIRHWEQARQGLTRALTAPDPLAAERAARESLDQAILASERLAMAHAEILLHRRFATRAASSATLGVRVWPGREGKKNLHELIATNFDLVVIPFRWKEIEVEEGVYHWGPIDRWIEWARGSGKPVVGGPLLDFSKAALPEWMYVWQHDYDTCRDLVYDFMEKVVYRYRSVVGMWNIASGLNVNDNFEFTAQQMIDLTRTANLLVRQNRRGARTMVELRQPFGEHVATAEHSIAPLAFVERLIQEGIKLDAVGVQVLFGDGGAGRRARDLLQVSTMLDRFLPLEMPVILSALGAPSAPASAGAGTWHDPWSPELQAKWIGRVFAMAMSKPFVESVLWTDLYDHDAADVPAAGLIDAKGKPKPSLSKLVGVRRRLKKPLGGMRLPDRAKA